MTLDNLIEELQEARETYGNIEVMSSSNYGDYHRTEQADPIIEIRACRLMKSAYSNSGLAVPTQDDFDEGIEFEEDNPNLTDEEILILRYTDG